MNFAVCLRQLIRTPAILLRMKKILFIFLLLPAFCNAQKWYVQYGAGYEDETTTNTNGYSLDINSGLSFGSIFRLGIGTSYFRCNQCFGSAYVPVYADLKIVGMGKLKPYIFFQPGYGIYTSEPITAMDINSNEVGTIYMHGGYSYNTGIGIIYKYAFLQLGYRMLTYTLKSPDFSKLIFTHYFMGISAGVSIP